MTSHSFKHLFIVFLLMVIVREDVLGQRKRRGRRTSGHHREFVILENICHHFVNDNYLTKSAKAATKEDAFVLANHILENQEIDLEKHPRTFDELVMPIYNFLVYVRIAEELQQTELNNIAIHHKSVYKNYHTAITLDIIEPKGKWVFTYSFTFKEGKEWKTKNWKVATVYCEYANISITTNNITIPDHIKQIAAKRAAQELKKD
jgi:hypothetical protein